MKDVVYNDKRKISSNKILIINNMLRSLGFKKSHNGYRFLIKAIEIKFLEYTETDFTSFNDIYNKVSNSYNNIKNPVQVDDSIYYTITHRNNTLTKKNFEKIFGFDYDDEIFTNKEFIEEFVNMLIMKEF